MHSFVFQIDSDMVRTTYSNDLNYIIEFDETCVDQKSCSIYFSSNDIYYPNSADVFRKRIIEKNVFEWYGIRTDNTFKHIFVRDIFKQWYLGGINHKINSPEYLLEFLKKETAGLTVTTIGSSAGGFAAVLYGSLLSAKRVFSFNGQFEVGSLLKTSTPAIDPLLFKNATSSLSKYFDIRNFINRDIDIYYFSSLYSKWDYQQYQHIKDIFSVKPILFRTSHHGVPFVKSALPVVINMESETLDKMVRKTFNPIYFSLCKGGIVKTIRVLCIQFVSKLKRAKYRIRW